MDGLQNLTNQNNDTDVTVQNGVESQEDWRWSAWIDYRALNGTIIEYDEHATDDKGRPAPGERVKKMNMQTLADKLKVSRQTLYDWEKTIPNFWERVRARKAELSSQRRLSFMEDKFYIHAMTWKNPMISLKWLEQNNPNWKDPRYKVEHELGSDMASLMHQLRAEKEAEQKTVIDAQVISHEAQQPDNT